MWEIGEPGKQNTSIHGHRRAKSAGDVRRCWCYSFLCVHSQFVEIVHLKAHRANANAIWSGATGREKPLMKMASWL